MARWLSWEALGILHDTRNFRAKDKILNEVMAELALFIAPMGQELRTVHLWTQRNSTCDILSRLSEGHQIPVELSNAMKMERKHMEFQLLGVQTESHAKLSGQ